MAFEHIEKIRREFRPMIATVRAIVLGIGSKLPLAPGKLHGDQSAITTDRNYFMKLWKKHGSIFKIWQKGKITTCIIGPELGYQFSRDNRDNLKNAVHDLSHLFPHGFIRGMEGATHNKYRRIFAAAFNAVPVSAQEAQIRQIIRTHLEELSQETGVKENSTLKVFAKKLSTALMLQLVLGAEFATEDGVAMTAAADQYTPEGMTRHISAVELRGYQKIAAYIREKVKRLMTETDVKPNLVANLVKPGGIDETVVGNLVQMVELGRYDLHGLFRWIMLEMAGHPKFLASIADETDPAKRRALTTSAAKEALRMHQSEFLARTATKKIEFEGNLIPKNSAVRICIWEGHRNPDKYSRPNTFVPERFIDEDFPIEIYAPFGLTHHRCLAEQWTFDISALLIEELARGYHLNLQNYGTPTVTKFHFEPGADSELEIVRK